MAESKQAEQTITLNWGEVQAILHKEFQSRGYAVASVIPDVKVRVSGGAAAPKPSVFDTIFGESDRVKLERLKQAAKPQPPQKAEVHSFRVHIVASSETGAQP